MLYITTRDNHDVHTAYKTLLSHTAADGGAYIPFQMPVFDQGKLHSMKHRTFGDITAEILNLFFSAGLTGWSVECAVGRNCIKTQPLGQKVMVSELWHNPGRTFDYFEKSLFSLVGGKNKVHSIPTDWFRIAVRICVLFGIYGQLLSDAYLHYDEKFHISVRTDDCSHIAAIWYAREMGLPVSMILCADTAESGIWDYVYHGELNTGTLHTQSTTGLERLTYAAWGAGECRRMVDAFANKSLFTVAEDFAPLSKDLSCSVIGFDRISNVVNSVYRNYEYLIDNATALPFAAVQDYRSKTGENRLTVIFGENDPALSADYISGATGLTLEDIASLQKK